MGFFSKPEEAPAKLHTCKLCQQDFVNENFNKDLGICKACTVIALSYIEKYFLPMVQQCEDSINAATDPDDKLVYYETLLETLYEYKIKYQDNDVKFMEQDVSDDITDIIDKISHVRD